MPNCDMLNVLVFVAYVGDSGLEATGEALLGSFKFHPGVTELVTTFSILRA